MTTHNNTSWTPNLDDGQILLFETSDGFKGHIRIGAYIFRVFLTHIADLQQGCRATLSLAGVAPDGAEITGKLIQNLNEEVCLREVRPAPLLFGHVTTSAEGSGLFEFVTWLKISKAGGRFVAGRVTPSADAES